MSTKVLVVDQNRDRALTTGKTLEYIDYEPVVVTDLDEFPGHADSKSEYLAVMLGEVSASAQLDKLLRLSRLTNGDVPLLMLPECSDDPSIAQRLESCRSWPLHSPIEQA